MKLITIYYLIEKNCKIIKCYLLLENNVTIKNISPPIGDLAILKLVINGRHQISLSRIAGLKNKVYISRYG